MEVRVTFQGDNTVQMTTRVVKIMLQKLKIVKETKEKEFQRLIS